MSQAATLLLETDKSVFEIASDVGYSNSGNFGGAFRRGYGVSPIRYHGGMGAARCRSELIPRLSGPKARARTKLSILETEEGGQQGQFEKISCWIVLFTYPSFPSPPCGFGEAPPFLPPLRLGCIINVVNRHCRTSEMENALPDYLSAFQNTSSAAAVIMSVALVLFSGFMATRLTKLPEAARRDRLHRFRYPDRAPACTSSPGSSRAWTSYRNIALTFIAFSTGEFFKVSVLKKNGRRWSSSRSWRRF